MPQDLHVFIFGAGASRSYGGPLLKGFLDAAPGQASSIDQESERRFEIVKRVRLELTRIHAHTTVDLENFEEVLSLVEMAADLNIEILRGHDPKSVLADCRRFVADRIESAVEVVQDKTGAIIGKDSTFMAGEYYKLAQHLISLEKDFAFLTFNYDASLDTALMNIGCYPCYTIEAIGKTSPPKKFATFRQVPVIKLHGSTLWKTCPCGEPIAYRVEDYNLIGDGYRDSRPRSRSITKGLTQTGPPKDWSESTLRMFCHDCCDPCESSDFDPFIMPPSLYKKPVSKFIQKSWSDACSLLSKATSITIIGYSWPKSDYFFKHLFAVGRLNGEILRSIDVIRPVGDGEQKTEAEKHYSSMFGPETIAKFKYSSNTFAGWLREMPTDGLRLLSDMLF